MKKYGEIYGNLLHDDVRKVTMDIIMVSDITEKKKAFENLKDNEEKYRILFENTTDLIQSLNAKGNFVDVNPAWLEALEYSKEELNNLILIDVVRKMKFNIVWNFLIKLSMVKLSKISRLFLFQKLGKKYL